MSSRLNIHMYTCNAQRGLIWLSNSRTRQSIRINYGFSIDEHVSRRLAPILIHCRRLPICRSTIWTEAGPRSAGRSAMKICVERSERGGSITGKIIDLAEGEFDRIARSLPQFPGEEFAIGTQYIIIFLPDFVNYTFLCLITRSLP